MNITRTTRALAALTLSALALTACGGNSDPLSSGGGESNDDPNSIIVGSANFTESETIANIYAEVLRINGFDVSTTLNIGSREAYIPAVKDGSIDLIPDYTGNLLQYLDPEATATSAEDVEAALPDALGSELAITEPAPAEDKDAIVVTRETAERWNLKTIADLAPHSAEISIGAPPEFQERAYGLPGLKTNYGVDIDPSKFVPIADGGGPATVAALAEGQVTAADIFSTSASIAENDFVVLEDPKFNFAAQNVVPVINAGKNSDKLTEVLNAISAKLTTEGLLALNQSVSGDTKTEPAAAAKQWVEEQGLSTPVS
ncbi:ABC transporter substrate-binding protein [Rhodococcus sp. Eu-32]|uniref:ABC transporter substrate-binding protein n=1 Tax=Rhodococcus sp. Eu-32 TaxID=1017319 RepID=UPI000DF4ACF0|nr:ABC transporter substrate-binding protein [Rhodococcus sp. Eu-32]RRQ29852.1 ABC transporter substrate-binding protein [Rhodococcus sp. Eu-32]